MAVDTLSPVSKTVASPTIDVGALKQHQFFYPTSIPGAVPTFTVPALSYSITPYPAWVGTPTVYVIPPPERPPVVWLHNKANLDETDFNDGKPLQEAVFSNFNDDMVLDIDSGTLVGRTDPDRGAAQRIIVISPLKLDELALSVDTAGLLGSAQAQLDKEEQERIAGLATEANARILGDSILQAQINAGAPIGGGGGTEVGVIEELISNEASIRSAADANEASIRSQADATETSNRIADVNTEEAARIANDNAINNALTTRINNTPPPTIYTNSATITVLGTKMKVTLQGGGGGGSGNNPGGWTPGTGGNGAMLLKVLTGLTPGLTLNLTIPNGGNPGVGTGNGGNCAATTLTSGSQGIGTLSAGGGFGGFSGTYDDSGTTGAPGIASGGDLNLRYPAGSSVYGGNGGAPFNAGQKGCAIIEWYY